MQSPSIHEKPDREHVQRHYTARRFELDSLCWYGQHSSILPIGGSKAALGKHAPDSVSFIFMQFLTEESVFAPKSGLVTPWSWKFLICHCFCLMLSRAMSGYISGLGITYFLHGSCGFNRCAFRSMHVICLN